MVDGRPPAGAPEPTRAGTDGATDELVIDPHGNVGAYVVDALDAPERAEFRAHLEFCPNCRVEVEEFREATAELALLTAARPPSALRGATLGAIRGVRPLPPQSPPPATRPVPPPPPEDVAPLDDHPSVMPWSLEFGARPAVEPAPSIRRAPTSRVNKLLAALAALAVVVSLGLGGWHAYWSTQRAAEVAAVSADAQQRAELLTAPDVRVLPALLDGAQVSYVVSQRQDRALFLGDQLPDPAAGQVYQLWLITGDDAVSAGVLTTGGTVQRWLSGPVADADQLAVTLEPGPAGSPAPTQLPKAVVPV